MADVLTRQQRHKNMKNIHGTDTKPEIDSEFFHGKGYYGYYESNKYSSLKEQLEHSNHSEFWLNKITHNMEHDEKINAELKGLGWTVIRFWSKDVIKDPEQCVRTIEEFIEDGKQRKDS